MQSTCSFAECGKPVHSRGRCTTHYRLLRKTEGAIQRRRSPGAAIARDPLGRKQCIGCAEWLAESNFGIGHERYADRLQSRCKSCTSDRHRLRKYGMTGAQLDDLIARQGGQCPICGRAVSRDQCAIDHDHNCCPGGTTCGKCVRGVLCGSCNSGLGLFNDDMESLARALSYLQKSKELTNGIEIF